MAGIPRFGRMASATNPVEGECIAELVICWHLRRQERVSFILHPPALKGLASFQYQVLYLS